MRLRYRAIIFDLDGTLVDSGAAVVASLSDVIARRGLPVDEGRIRALVGRRIDEIVGAVAAGLDAAEREAVLFEYRLRYAERASREERLFDGVPDLLFAARRAGYHIGVATGKSQAGADEAIERHRLWGYVDAVHGILPGTPGKPHPAVYRRALVALSVSAPESLMVGDTTYDIDMAAAAGSDSVAVTWGMHPVHALISRRPTMVVDRVDELAEWLLRPAGGWRGGPRYGY